MTYDKILFSPVQPSRTDIAWAKPVKGGFALYLHFNGKWQPQMVMNDMGTLTPDDDQPMSIGTGQLGPDSVGTEHIIDNNVMLKDLNSEVTDKLDDIYVLENESLYINGTKPEEE